MICEFDKLTMDTLPNQILKATCLRLLGVSSQLTQENRSELHVAREMLEGISPLHISSRTFRYVQLHRNNRHYRLLMHVCQMLHELYLPEEGAGARRFRDILDEETMMHRVFENFVRKFAVRHCPDAFVSAMKIKWVGKWSEEVGRVLPEMSTDVTLERVDRKTILDCKYYRDAVKRRYDSYRLHSSHLYQLVAYLQNKAHDPGWESVSGILVYPTVEQHLSLDFELLGHRVEIQSLDLGTPWPVIHDRLLEILA